MSLKVFFVKEMDESQQHHDAVDEDAHTTDGDEQMDESEQHHDTVDEDEHTADENEQTTDEDDGHEDGEEEGDSEEREGDYIERAYNEGEYVAMHTSEYRFGAPIALVKQQLERPGMAVIEWRAKSGERMGVARARVQEKFSRASADINYGVYAFTHPTHPIRRKVAKDIKKQKKLLAADRRKQQELAAKSKAAAKIARARAGEIATLNEGVIP